MERDWLLFIAAFFSSFAISLLSTPFAKKLAFKFGAVDKPKDRGMHKHPLPRLGGVAIVLGFVATLLILLPFIPALQTKQLLGFLAGGVIIVTLGVFDDINELSARTKLCFQLVAAIICIASGIRIDVLWWPFAFDLELLSMPVTLLWIIGVTNAVNLIDGLDGLAAGVSTIAAICLAILCFLSGSTLAVVLSIMLAGACLGFLPRNFNPAEIIMGDTGATFLGYVLSVCSIMGLFKGYVLLAILVAVLPLSLPIFDTLFAIMRRIKNGVPMMQGDRGHLHHRLIDKGFSHKQAVIFLYIISLIGCILAIVIAVRDIRAIIIAVVAIAVMGLMSIVYGKRLL